MIIGFYLLLVAGAQAPAAAAPRQLPADTWVGKSAQEIGLELGKIHASQPSYEKRLLEISRHFLGAPYKFSPLGEASGDDSDPMFTANEFDCLSLVEISMALAATPSIEQALVKLQQLRYLGPKVIYTDRKHFMESQWIPENTRAGWLKDVTRQVGGKLAVPVQKTLNPELYAKRKQLADLDLPPERIPNGTFQWWAIPLDKMEEIERKIPSGALLFVVRDDYRTTPYRITHVGIVIQKKGGTYLRHAKDQGAHMVLDMPLQAVVKRHAEFVKWPVTGFSLYVPQQPL